METSKPVFAVLGAGHGGTAMAADLALRGFEVRLWNRSLERLQAIQQRGGVDLVVAANCPLSGGAARIDVATTDIEQAISGADIIMVVVPALGHELVACACAPHLTDSQMIVLNPGRTGGALEFRRVLLEEGCKANVILGEAETFLFASRVVSPAQSRIFAVKSTVAVAALPAYRTGELLKRLRLAYPQFVAADNVLQTSLSNVAVMFHPAVMIVNAARIEDQHGNFDYYHSGITPSVARYLEAVDTERLAVAQSVGVRVIPVRKWLYMAYDAPGRDLFEAIQANTGYAGIKAPPTLAYRYLMEDAPMCLVPMISIGEQYGCDMTLMRSITQVAGALLDVDFFATGRTVERLGIDGMDVRRLRRLVLEGEDNGD